jgi:hypothetical protein
MHGRLGTLLLLLAMLARIKTANSRARPWAVTACQKIYVPLNKHTPFDTELAAHLPVRAASWRYGD